MCPVELTFCYDTLILEELSKKRSQLTEYMDKSNKKSGLCVITSLLKFSEVRMLSFNFLFVQILFGCVEILETILFNIMIHVEYYKLIKFQKAKIFNI